uniref:hypothetical protein n=1 Tax=Candidatus Paracaedibacter symbiosus TaxID=244582 RepID=UPI0005098761
SGKEGPILQKEAQGVSLSSSQENKSVNASIEAIKAIIERNPQYNAAEDIVNRVYKTYSGLKDIISNGPPLSEKDNLHLLKQCVYATGEALNTRKMCKDPSSHSLIDRAQAEKSAWMQAVAIEKTDSLRIQLPYQSIQAATAFRESWSNAATQAAFNISLPNPTMDSTFTSIMGQEAIRLVNLLPNHHAQIKDFIHQQASHIDSNQQSLVKGATALADIKGVETDPKSENIIVAAKTLLIKEMIKDPAKDPSFSASPFVDKINLEAKQEQQRLQFIEQRSLQQQQLQNQRTL